MINFNNFFHKLKLFSNGFLFFCSVWSGFVLACFCYTANHSYSELSISLYGTDRPLMNSYFLEYTATWVMSLVLLVLVLFVVFKRIYIKKFKYIILVNAISALFFIILGSMIFYKTYSVTLH